MMMMMMGHIGWIGFPQCIFGGLLFGFSPCVLVKLSSELFLSLGVCVSNCLSLCDDCDDNDIGTYGTDTQFSSIPQCIFLYFLYFCGGRLLFVFLFSLCVCEIWTPSELSLGFSSSHLQEGVR